MCSFFEELKSFALEMIKAQMAQFGQLNPSEKELEESFKEFAGNLKENIINDETGWVVQKNKPTLLDGAVTQEAFVKKNMQNSLKGKVRRNNNLAVEIQGAVVITRK